MLFNLLIVALADLLVGFVIAVIVIASAADFLHRDRGEYDAFVDRHGLQDPETLVASLLTLLVGIRSLFAAYATVIHLPTRGLRSKQVSYYWLFVCGFLSLLLVAHLAYFAPRSITVGGVVLLIALGFYALLNLQCALRARWHTLTRRGEPEEE